MEKTAMEDIPHWIMQTERLRFRRLRADDFVLIAPILQDEQIMYAWEHGFDYNEVCDWLADELRRYREDGCGHCAGFDRQTGELVALAGALVEQLPEGPAYGVAYIVDRRHWGKGYGVECATASLRRAFLELGADRAVAVIRPENRPSRRVAEACGMKPAGEFIRHYRGKDMPHIIYELRRPE